MFFLDSEKKLQPALLNSFLPSLFSVYYLGREYIKLSFSLGLKSKKDGI